MLVFQTQFTVDYNNNIDSLLKTAIKWVSGSQHSQFIESDFKNKINASNISFSKENESVKILKYSSNIFQGLGFRYEKTDTDNGQESWTTEIVGAKTETSYWITVQVYWDSNIPTTQKPTPKKPYIVRQILDDMNGGKDGELKVLDKAYILKKEDLSFVDKIIGGETNYLMPVIYVSVDKNNKTYIDTVKLAQNLAGMAHVIVEPNREFSYDLMELTNRQNVYLGAIGIYWPAKMGVTRFFPTGKFENEKELSTHLQNKIRDALISQRIKRECSWSYIKELISKEKYSLLKKEGSTAVDEYMEVFDAEIAAKDEQLQSAENEIRRLQCLLSEANANTTASEKRSLLIIGDEKELYPGEYNDLVYDIIDENLKNSLHDSRKEILLSTIIKNNTRIGKKDELLEKLKNALHGYQRMDTKTKSLLEEIGFTITDDGKHHKMTFKNDKRYMFVTSKTSSDHRAGKNLTSDIKKKLFW